MWLGVVLTLKSLYELLSKWPSEDYLDWLFPQSKKASYYGLWLLFVTFTALSLVDYFYYAGDYYGKLPNSQGKPFGWDNFYRLVAVPAINLIIVLIVRNSKRLRFNKLEKLVGLTMVCIVSSLLFTGLCHKYYTADDYTFEVLMLIVFSHTLLGLRFRTKFYLSLLMLCSVLVYLGLDEIELKTKVYAMTFTLLIWAQMVMSSMRLGLSRRTNFQTISQLETAAQELKIHARALSLKNEDLQQFAYASSHDLQEPLRSISNFVNILDRRASQQLSEEHKTYLGIIQNSTERMRNLIHAILDYSRIGRNPKFESINCNEVLAAVLIDLDFALKSSGATIQANSLPDIVGYKTEFTLLLQNLIGNALKFHRKGIAPLVKISAFVKDQDYVFSVADNGIGIESQYIHKIFQLFSRLHSKEEYEGTGIGLTHCKKITDLHGGKIWVESVPGQGATFYFTIPRYQKISTHHEKEIGLHHAH